MASAEADASAAAPILHAPTREDVIAFRGKLVKLARELLVTKSTSTTAGIVLHYSITYTVIAVFFWGNAVAVLKPTDKKDAQSITKAFLVTFSVFGGLLAGTVYLTRFIQNLEQVPQLAKDTYCRGLNLIPAWAWKDVIANLYAVLVIFGVVNKDSPPQVCLFAIGASLLAANAYLMLQMATSHMEKTSFARCVVGSLMTSFALGCGWGLNVAVRSFIGTEAFTGSGFCLRYAAVLTVLTPTLQHYLKRLTEVVKENTPTVPGTGNATVAFCKAMEFLGLAVNFVMGWGWKSLFDVSTTGMRATTLDNFFAALLITMICILGPALVGMTGAPTAVNSSLALCAGMNIGWAWVDFIMFCMKAQPMLNLLIVWVNCILVLGTVMVFAEAADRVIRLFEHIEDYIPPVKLPGLDVEYGSTEKPVPAEPAEGASSSRD